MMPSGRTSAATARRRSKPDISGNSTPKSTMSGLRGPAASIAAVPQAASPTTCTSSLRQHSRIRLLRVSAWLSTITTFTSVPERGQRWGITASALTCAYCRWKAGLLTKEALDRCDLAIPQPQILHVAQRLAVGGMTDVHHHCLVAASKYPLQLKAPDEILLRLPALGLKSALVDVVVTCRA